MKNHPFFFCIPVFTVIFTASPGCIRKDPARSIRLLATPALAAQGGFLQAMKGAFKKESGCTLDIQEAEGASGVISILSSPKEAERVDAVIGIDEMVFDRVRSHLETSAQPDPRILPLLSKRIQPGFVPLHYSPLSMIYRKAALKENALPHRLSDLLKPALKKKFILQDPRASTPGMMFFLFASSLSVRDLRARWSALVPGWDASYKRFLEGEAPMVWSYLSSLAYHASKGQDGEFGFIDFEEGLPLQLEGAGVVKHSAPHTDCVDSWLGFLLKPEVLADLAARQFVFPAYRDVKLPPHFDRVPAFRKAAEFDATGDALDRLLSSFGKEVRGDGF